MTAKVPFAPAYGSGATVAAGAAAAATLPTGDSQVCITNTGSAIAYVAVKEAGNASAVDYPVLPGTQVVITKSVTQTRISYFCATATTLHIMTGNGW